MTYLSNRIICEHCDSVYTAVTLIRREDAKCSRCYAVLRRSTHLSNQQLLALTITAALLFIAANVFPVIEISLQGLSNQATLMTSIMALAHGAPGPIAVVACLAIIIAPMSQILLLCWVLSFASAGIAAPGFRGCMRTLEYLRPWSMLEVCLLGILVAIIKLGGMLDVHPGIGLWALAMLSVLLILISGKGIRRLWDELGIGP